MFRTVQRKFLLVVGIALVAALVVLVVFARSYLRRDVAEDAPVFLDGTTINGIDVSGLTAKEAAALLSEQPDSYVFTLTLGENVYTMTGEELALTYNSDADLNELIERQTEDVYMTAFTVSDLYTADISPLSVLLEQDYPPAEEPETVTDDGEDVGDDYIDLDYEELLAAAEEGEAEAEPEDAADYAAPVNATISYDIMTASFVIEPDRAGLNLDCDAVAERALDSVLLLEAELELTEDAFHSKADITADDPELLAALEEANRCLDLDLTYTFTPSGGESSDVKLSRDDLGTFYFLNADCQIQINEDNLSAYVADLADLYSTSSNSTQFRTHDGNYITIDVASAGQTVDSAALYSDMYDCLDTRTGGVRTAPYEAETDNADNAWGGNYVEVDLGDQRLWLYKNGDCLLTCDIVSGCVANGTPTPTGCFTIFAKNTDRYLEGTNTDGSTYKSWVSYFMPFSGGCGIHDATWRSNFGGTIYYYNGSHGCVGVSLSNAKTIYENVEVGTHVIVYGGITSEDMATQEQNLSVTGVGSVMEPGTAVTLKVSGNTGPLTYSSSDTSVLKVDLDGQVTAVAEGSATITVTAAAKGTYQEASKTLNVTVGHDWKEVYSTTTVTHKVTSKTTTQEVETGQKITGYQCLTCGQTFTSDPGTHTVTVETTQEFIDEEGNITTDIVEAEEVCSGKAVPIYESVVETQTTTTYTCSVNGCNADISTQKKADAHNGKTETTKVLTGYECSVCGKKKS